VSDWYGGDLDRDDDDAEADEDEQFDWDDGNLDHLSHGVTPGEAEEAVLDHLAISTGAYNSASERRWAVIGATEAGRNQLDVCK
jgi:uncharacterized DUF497 family protein